MVKSWKIARPFFLMQNCILTEASSDFWGTSRVLPGSLKGVGQLQKTNCASASHVNVSRVALRRPRTHVYMFRGKQRDVVEEEDVTVL